MITRFLEPRWEWETVREWISENGNVGLVTNEEGSSLYRPNMAIGWSPWDLPVGTMLSQSKVAPSLEWGLALVMSPNSHWGCVLVETTKGHHSVCVSYTDPISTGCFLVRNLGSTTRDSYCYIWTQLGFSIVLIHSCSNLWVSMLIFMWINQ